MRTMRVVLLATLAAVLVSLILVIEGSASVLPRSSYQWLQPGCASVTTLNAQPPASIPIAAPSVTPSPGSDYRWMQPGCAPVDTAYAQPPV
jgi:hypothetical protein